MMEANTHESDSRGWGGLPMVLLIAAATVLAWLFPNPFVGFIVVLVAGLAVLACIDYRRRRSSKRPDESDISH